MLSKGIKFKNFIKNKKNKKIKNGFQSIIKEKNYVLDSLRSTYKNFFTEKKIKKFKKFSNIKIIGMGGSTLGTQAIYDFLIKKIKKKVLFIDNLQSNPTLNQKKNFLNLVVSKSGNTIETIVNANIHIKKAEKSIFITENKKNYLNLLAQDLKAEIIHHHNFIGGRYSVLSEVGMLPAELMGLNSNKFRQLNSLIKNKKFIDSLITNVDYTLNLIKKKKFNSVIINYDQKSENLFKWYQQLIAESLGKKKKGILPIVSTMPKDNHSVMQLYLDGFQSNFYTFFFVHDERSEKVKNESILPSKKFLKDKNISEIIYAQKRATENVFMKKKTLS